VVFGSAYLPSVVPMQVLVWSIPVALTRNVIQSLLIARGQQDLMMRTSAWAAGSNLALNFAIIPFAGMKGAASVTLVTELVRLIRRNLAPAIRTFRKSGD
jgi:O-antigen/teichoic acid export membrane protein